MTLQHVDPSAPTGVVRRGYVAFLRTPPGRWVAINIAARVDPWLLRRSNGRVGMALMLPSALLATTGAKSGAPRECTVLYFHDGADVILAASSYGRDAHPAWYHNLVAHPDCSLGGERFTAAVIDDAAGQDRAWGLADQLYAGFADYRRRGAAAGRTIPLLRLTSAA